jgi:hypothetical protein
LLDLRRCLGVRRLAVSVTCIDERRGIRRLSPQIRPHIC